jgi:glycine oxidase
LAGLALDSGTIGPIVRREHTYILQRTRGFTIVGTSSEHCGFDRSLDTSILSEIHERAAVLIPSLGGHSFAESWVGFRPGIESEGPAIGPVADTSLWLAYGHYRNGILMAPLTAERVAAGITASSETGWSAPSGMR